MDKLYKWSITLLLPKGDTNDTVVAKNKTGPKIMCRLSPHACSGEQRGQCEWVCRPQCISRTCIPWCGAYTQSYCAHRQNPSCQGNITALSTCGSNSLNKYHMEESQRRRSLLAVQINLQLYSAVQWKEGKKNKEIKTTIWDSNSNWTGPFHSKTFIKGNFCFYWKLKMICDTQEVRPNDDIVFCCLRDHMTAHNNCDFVYKCSAYQPWNPVYVVTKLDKCQKYLYEIIHTHDSYAGSLREPKENFEKKK